MLRGWKRPVKPSPRVEIWSGTYGHRISIPSHAYLQPSILAQLQFRSPQVEDIDLGEPNPRCKVNPLTTNTADMNFIVGVAHQTAQCKLNQKGRGTYT